MVPVILAAALVVASPCFAGSYMLTDHWGGHWVDADKTAGNTEDDLMCWAAAASNILEWTRWGDVAGMVTSDGMFAYYQDHWTDMGGLMEYGWEWWFTGRNAKQGKSGWSQVDVPGGQFFPDEPFGDYYEGTTAWAAAMSSVRSFLGAGMGTGIGIYTETKGHAVTVWGYEYGSGPLDYRGLYITDSDDGVEGLRYYGVSYNATNSKWYLVNYIGTGNWYIGAVQALSPRPIPEPVTALAVLLGAGGLAGYLRRQVHRGYRESANPGSVAVRDAFRGVSPRSEA